MFGNVVVRTKFLPPYYKSKIFSREHLKNIFNKTTQYPLTMIKAGPGYGKSAYLTYGFKNKGNVYWYNVSRGDGDVLTFLINLIYAFNTTNSKIGDKTLNLIKEKGETNQEWIPVLNSLINEIWDKYRYQEVYLIIDDYHLLNNQTSINRLMEHFIEHRPPNMHFIISTRTTPDIPSLSIWRVKDQLLKIKEDDLRLNKNEIKSYYNDHYELNLNDQDVKKIFNLTEGWIIGVEMIRQGIKEDGTLSLIDQKSLGSLEHLFNYLAKEILSKQNEEIRSFLINTSVLRVMTAEVCDFIRNKKNSSQILNYLSKNDLFIIQLDDQKYRYHHLFHDFLKKYAKEEISNISFLQKKIAKFYQNKKKYEEAIYYNLESGDYYTAAKILKDRANKLLITGRFTIFDNWFNKLPERIIENFPSLYLYKGDIARYTCNYNQALDWYKQARRYLKEKDDVKGISDAYQKMAMIYLDTVQPTKADKYLKKALEIREKDNYWEESLLLRLVAENYLNIGNVKKAKEMQRKLEKLDEESNNVILDSRVKIRTGRLREAEEILINELNKENNKESKKVGRAHRETILLLSLISSLEGEKKKALKYAKKGLEKSKNLDSLFTQAVANMRLGHAYQISNLDQYDTAIKHYEKSLEIVDKLNVRRGRAEALWGLTLVYGSLGKKEQMKQYGHEGIKICDKAGDEWLKSLIQLSLGIGFIQLNEYKDALSWLTMAVKSFDYCNDIFGKTVGQIWLTLIDCKLDHKMDFKQRLEEIVPIIVENDLEFIFKKSNLLGSRDNEILIPILTEGFNLDIEHNFCERILKSLNIRPGVNHPGYTLRTKTLGQFKLFRGNNEVKNSEWKRKKAKILFKLFLTFKDRLIPKDRLAEMISPNKNQKSANRDFKVALNALNNVLEPNREARETPYFIIKRDSSYGLNQNVSYDLDFIRFENMIKEGIKLNRKQDIDSAIEYLKKGVEIYNGDFLLNCIYLDWSRETRDKFKNLFIQGTETLAQLYYKKEMYQKTIQIAERLLAEESSIEKAYQIMMKALIKMDQRSQAIKVYNKCVDILKKDLGVIPSQKTIDLYKKVKGK